MIIDLNVTQALAIGLTVFIPCCLLFFRKNKFSKNVLICLLFMYVCVVISLTQTIRLFVSLNMQNISYQMHNIELDPISGPLQIFKNCARMGNYKEFIRLIGGNFIMLMPLGVLVPLINPKFRLKRMVLLAIGVAFSIEFLQYIGNIFLGGCRTVEMADFILNSTGCILAYLIFACFRPKRKLV